MKYWVTSWRGGVIGVVLFAAAIFGAWYGLARPKPLVASSLVASDSKMAPATGVAVEVVFPRPGGIDRICHQPGTVEPYEAADLYTKVSGFLVEQHVDIGYPVKAGDV